MRSKIISFLIGCLIGGLIGGYQISAWAMPTGYKELAEYGKEISDPEEYMEINKVDITLEVEEACEKYGEKYDICPEILEAICWRESRCQPDVSNGSCKGLMQINTSVHSERMKKLKVKDIYDVDGNVKVGADLLAELDSKNNNIAKSLDEYNGNKQGGKSKYTKETLTVASVLDRVGGD